MITLAIEFTKPDLLLREKIWRSMAPPKLPLGDDIDFMALARKFELPGGKLAYGEQPEDALRRYLHDDAGIHIEDKGTGERTWLQEQNGMYMPRL